MSIFRKYFVFFGLVFLICFIIFRLLPKPDFMKVKNDVSFEGVITDFDNSGRLHGFGIVRVQITKSNTKIFNAFQKEKVYPYNINNNNGEIYTYIPYNMKIGEIVRVNSKKDQIEYYENNKFLYKEEIFLIDEEDRIEFIKKEKRLNN